jgi:hypothetical protein
VVVLANRVKVTTATPGTGTLTLGLPVDAFQSFAAGGINTGDTVRYTIEAGNNWEIGVGVYSAIGPTMTRVVTESSIGGAPLNLGGTSVVYLTAAAEDLATKDQATSIALALVIALG